MAEGTVAQGGEVTPFRSQRGMNRKERERKKGRQDSQESDPRAEVRSADSLLLSSALREAAGWPLCIQKTNHIPSSWGFHARFLGLHESPKPVWLELQTPSM